MDRIKTKIVKNSDQLKEECEVVKLMLTNILEKNNEVVNELTNITDNDVTTHKKYLLDVIKFQSTVLQKLLEMGVDLEVFLKELPAPTSDNSLLTIRDATSRSNTSLCLKICPSDASVPNKLFLPDEGTVKDEPSILEDIKRDKIVEIVTSEAEKEEEQQQTLIASCSKTVEVKEIIKEDKTDKLTAAMPQQEKSKTDAVPNDSSSDASSTTSNKGKEKSSADVSSSEDVSLNKDGKRKTIHEKFKSKKLMTRRDRFLQNIQRPDIPDLSFRPSTNVFGSNEIYLTCPESGSSTSTNKVKDKKRKKKQGAETNSTTSSMSKGFRDPPEPYINLDCLISRVINPSEFYINHLDENVALVDTMAYQLAEIFRDTRCPYKDKKSAREALGSECVCYLENYGSWYRVAVTNWRLQTREYEDKMVTVYLVDYGHTCNTSYENLRELSEEFCYVPQLAIRCHLAWLYPPGSTKNNLLETWPKESYDFFHQLFSESSECIYKVVYAEKCGTSWAIDLAYADTKNTSGDTFGQQMLDKGLAVEIFQDPLTMFKDGFFLNQIRTAQGMAGITSNMTTEERFDQLSQNMDHIVTQECSNIDEAMVGYRARDEARICKNMRPDGTCFKGKRCKMEHETLRKDGITTDKQSVYISAFNELELPEVGSKIKLRITNVVSVNTFYGCIINSQSESLNLLINTMNKRDNIAKYKPLEVPPAPGELVIAKNWNDHWYRAMVRDLYHHPQNREETVQVFFVDLGDIVDTTMSKLRLMNPDFLLLPFQAVLCRLYNVKPKENNHSAEAKEYVESHFLCQIFDAEVMHVSHSMLEVLLKRDNDDTEDVGEQIIDDGYGDLRTDHLFPITTENLLVD